MTNQVYTVYASEVVYSFPLFTYNRQACPIVKYYVSAVAAEMPGGTDPLEQEFFTYDEVTDNLSEPTTNDIKFQTNDNFWGMHNGGSFTIEVTGETVGGKLTETKSFTLTITQDCSSTFLGAPVAADLAR